VHHAGAHALAIGLSGVNVATGGRDIGTALRSFWLPKPHIGGFQQMCAMQEHMPSLFQFLGCEVGMVVVEIQHSTLNYIFGK